MFDNQGESEDQIKNSLVLPYLASLILGQTEIGQLLVPQDEVIEQSTDGEIKKIQQIIQNKPKLTDQSSKQFQFVPRFTLPKHRYSRYNAIFNFQINPFLFKLVFINFKTNPNFIKKDLKSMVKSVNENQLEMAIFLIKSGFKISFMKWFKNKQYSFDQMLYILENAFPLKDYFKTQSQMIEAPYTFFRSNNFIKEDIKISIDLSKLEEFDTIINENQQTIRKQQFQLLDKLFNKNLKTIVNKYFEFHKSSNFNLIYYFLEVIQNQKMVCKQTITMKDLEKRLWYMNFEDLAHDLIIQEKLKLVLNKKVLFKAQIDSKTNDFYKYSVNTDTDKSFINHQQSVLAQFDDLDYGESNPNFNQVIPIQRWKSRFFAQLLYILDTQDTKNTFKEIVDFVNGLFEYQDISKYKMIRNVVLHSKYETTNQIQEEKFKYKEFGQLYDQVKIVLDAIEIYDSSFKNDYYKKMSQTLNNSQLMNIEIHLIDDKELLDIIVQALMVQNQLFRHVFKFKLYFNLDSIIANLKFNQETNSRFPLTQRFCRFIIELFGSFLEKIQKQLDQTALITFNINGSGQSASKIEGRRIISQININDLKNDDAVDRIITNIVSSQSKIFILKFINQSTKLLKAQLKIETVTILNQDFVNQFSDEELHKIYNILILNTSYKYNKKKKEPFTLKDPLMILIYSLTPKFFVSPLFQLKSLSLEYVSKEVIENDRKFKFSQYLKSYRSHEIKDSDSLLQFGFDFELKQVILNEVRFLPYQILKSVCLEKDLISLLRLDFLRHYKSYPSISIQLESFYEIMQKKNEKEEQEMIMLLNLAIRSNYLGIRDAFIYQMNNAFDQNFEVTDRIKGKLKSGKIKKVPVIYSLTKGMVVEFDIEKSEINIKEEDEESLKTQEQYLVQETRTKKLRRRKYYIPWNDKFSQKKTKEIVQMKKIAHVLTQINIDQ